jgi:hypothetical protein
MSIAPLTSRPDGTRRPPQPVLDDYMGYSTFSTRRSKNHGGRPARGVDPRLRR